MMMLPRDTPCTDLFSPAKIDKLQILGVRSFGNKKGETIQFNTPLTLIVGQNGSGKTTIIECLKYATTGELPPNSKTGGAFIHDPKLCGEKEVLAQVKLSFKSTSGARMVATRNLQLTVKKTARSQKTLEASLLMIKDGERHAISSRVAELDQILPQYLGVSKAILESVIFCHQDESLWPLSEPAVLKKRFDEIFEALKYTKAIENIKVLRKKQGDELQKLKIIEGHAREDRDRGTRSEKRQGELYDEIGELREQWEAGEEKVKEAEAKAQEAFDHAARFEQIVAQLNGKRIQLDAARETITDLEANIKEMAESDEELQSMLDQYEERIALYNEEQNTLRQQYVNFGNELENGRNLLGVKQSEVGKHEAEKEQHARHLKQREALIKETAQVHGIRGFDYEVTDSQVTDFLDIIRKSSKDQKRALDRARQELQEELRKAQSVVNQLNERKSALTQSKDIARSQITSNDQKIAKFQVDMDNIEVDEGGEAVLKDKKDETERQLKKATSDAATANLDNQLRDADAVARRLDSRKEELDAELVEASRSARDSAAIDNAQDDLKTLRHKLETMKGAHGSRISKLVEPNWQFDSLDTAFQAALSQETTKVKEAESIRDAAQNKLDTINYRITSIESEKNKKLAEIQECEQILQKAVGEGENIADFEELLQDLEQRYEIATTDQAKFKAQIGYFEDCIKTAKQHNQCRLCKRSLIDDKAENFSKTGFISMIEQIIKKASSNAQEDNVDDLAAELEEMRGAKPSYDLLMRLRNIELPAFRSDANKLTSDRDAVNKELEEQDSVIYDLRSSKQDVESLSKNVQTIVQYNNQAHDLEKKIQELSEKQKAAGMSRGIDAVQEDLKKINDDFRIAKATLSRLTADKEKSRTQITNLELKVRDINAELNSAQSKLRDKQALVSRIDELKMHTSEQKEAIRGFDKDIQQLLPKVEQAQLEYDDIERRGNDKVTRLQQDVSKLSDSERQLAYAEQEINAYIDKGGPQQLAKTQKDIENLKSQISKVEQEQVQVGRQIKKIENTVADTESTKRSIGDNVRYRTHKRNLRALQSEIQELETHDAEQDKDRYEGEGTQWRHEWHRLSTEQASLVTTIKNKDDQLKELTDEWETEYRNAAFKYKEAHIKVETTKAAVEDLGRYGGALDKAIMKYHTLKMEEINRIVEELWKMAYHGSDVDRILIKSDNETARGNRSYNYRVVMVKQDAEMDMRGRCSAGQKVLASIVIRLALAECFGTSCGLIALDEPTTNLDKDNIEGLAKSLSEIIRVRQKQSNFQLIVITHDEQFLRSMNCGDYCDTYYRVDRDVEQKSVIKRQQIADVI